MQTNSILLNTDSYKVSMWKQYPPGTEYVYSYIEARGGPTDNLVWFGIQAFIQEYLTNPITEQDVLMAGAIWEAHGEPFNWDGWRYIVEKHGGYLPIEIRQIEEGTILPVKMVLATVVNTDPAVPWLTTWVETALLRAAWYGTNVASTSYRIKELISQYLDVSGDMAGLPFKLHDFGARGANCFEASGIGGAAHLINFMGTDNMTGILHAHKFYGAPLKATGFSIPAAEHSTITSWGHANEEKAYANQFAQFGEKDKIFAVVSDSYNIYDACEMWGSMADQIKEAGTTLVVRPDSGDPCEVLPRVLRLLEKGFGATLNDKGYKVLNNVRVLWGDGIEYQSIRSILRTVVDVMGFSADNLAFGMGGALLQKHDRDTYKFAMKCSAICVDGDWRDVYKDPVTDMGKVSKRGLVTTFRERHVPDGWFVACLDEVNGPDELRPVFKNGEAGDYFNFEQIRANAAKFYENEGVF